MVFTLAIVFASTTTRGAIGGGAAGLAVSLVIAFAIYRLGKRLNIALFFTVVGAVLMVFAAGILMDAVENLQQLGWLPILTHPMWNTSHLLSEDSTVGDIFHSFFGYADSPTVGQGVIYLVYLTTAVGAFVAWRPTRRPPTTNRAAVPAGGGAQLPAT
jgi:high-affinity iron transporter